MTCVEVLVQDLFGLRRASGSGADLFVLLQEVLLEPRLTARLPSQSGEQSSAPHGYMRWHVSGQLLLST